MLSKITIPEYDRDLIVQYNFKELLLEYDTEHRHMRYDILDSIQDDELRRMIYDKKGELRMSRPKIRTSDIKIIDECMEDMYYAPIKSTLKILEYELKKRTSHSQRDDKFALEKKKQEIDIIQVVESYIHIGRYKPWSLIKCVLPEHQDKTSSMMLYPKTNTFYCYWCRAHGSQIDFIMKMENCSLGSAIKKFLTY